MPDSLRGHLLLAAPSLFDPNFRRTVVLITEHTDDGAMGLVLNRAAEVTVADAVPDLSMYAAEFDEPLYVGGPVQTNSVIVVAEFDDPELSADVFMEGDIGFVPANADDHELLAATCRRTRVFAGHSGWGPGQLEAEMEEKAWIVEPAIREDLFETRPDELWSAVMRRKGGQFRLISTMPEDPALN